MHGRVDGMCRCRLGHILQAVVGAAALQDAACAQCAGLAPGVLLPFPYLSSRCAQRRRRWAVKHSAWASSRISAIGRRSAPGGAARVAAVRTRRLQTRLAPSPTTAALALPVEPEHAEQDEESEKDAKAAAATEKTCDVTREAAIGFARPVPTSAAAGGLGPSPRPALAARHTVPRSLHAPGRPAPLLALAAGDALPLLRVGRLLLPGPAACGRCGLGLAAVEATIIVRGHFCRKRVRAPGLWGVCALWARSWGATLRL